MRLETQAHRLKGVRPRRAQGSHHFDSSMCKLADPKTRGHGRERPSGWGAITTFMYIPRVCRARAARDGGCMCFNLAYTCSERADIL